MLEQMKGNATKYCACHDICRLPRNLCPALRKCCACREICTCACHEILLDHAKVSRLPRNLHLTCESVAPATKYTSAMRKCCACHEILSLRNLRVVVTVGPRPGTVRTGTAAEVPFAHLRQRLPAPCQAFAHSLSFRALRQDAGILPLPRNLH